MVTTIRELTYPQRAIYLASDHQVFNISRSRNSIRLRAHFIQGEDIHVQLTISSLLLATCSSMAKSTSFEDQVFDVTSGTRLWDMSWRQIIPEGFFSFPEDECQIWIPVIELTSFVTNTSQNFPALIRLIKARCVDKYHTSTRMWDRKVLDRRWCPLLLHGFTNNGIGGLVYKIISHCFTDSRLGECKWFP